MYIRFVTDKIDERTGRKEGLFTHAYNSIWNMQDNDYDGWEYDYLKGILTWFSDNMPAPTKFSRKKNKSHIDTQGISWFKDIGGRDIESKLWELKSFFENDNINIEIIKTKIPGYIVYEDDCQVAEPMGCTFT